MRKNIREGREELGGRVISLLGLLVNGGEVGAMVRPR